MKVHLLGWTQFNAELAKEITGWETDADGGSALVEFAGRSCYQSWAKPNPVTATNKGYIENIFSHAHFSVLEHSQVSLYITGVSRALTHELVRHRHFSFSQLSQRYVPSNDVKFIKPEAIANDQDLNGVFEEAVQIASRAYDLLEKNLRVKYGVNETSAKKKAREVARSVLPNATETRIVVTGNYRTWMEFIEKRGARFADVEIRTLAIEVLGILKAVAPNVFNRYEVHEFENLKWIS